MNKLIMATSRTPLSSKLYFFSIFLIPFFAVSPLTKFFGIPGGVIFGFAVLLTLVALLKERGFKPLVATLWETPLLKLLLLFLLVNIVSLAGAGRSLGQENYAEFAYLAFSMVVFWLTANLAKEETFAISLRVYFFACTISAIWGLYVTLGFMAGIDTGQLVTWTVPRLFGTSAEPQVYGNFLLSIIPLGTTFLLMQLEIVHKTILIIGLVLLMLAMVMTFSAGAWGGLMGSFGLLIIGLKYFKSKGIFSWIGSMVSVVIIVVLIDHLLYPGYVEGFKSIAYKFDPSLAKGIQTSTQKTYLLSAGSGIERQNLRQAAWNMFRTHPIIGVGTGNFGYLYNAYRPTGTEAFPFVAKAHNQYLEVLAETGVVGFTVFMLIIAQLVMMIWRSWRATREIFWKTIILGGFASLAGVAIQGYSFGFFVHIYTWVLLGLLASVYRQAVSAKSFLSRGMEG